MINFIGDFPCKLDAKGRLSLPAAFKKQMQAVGQEDFVIKKDIFENCLVLYPINEWQEQVELLNKKINPYNREHNKFVREFHRGKAELSIDTAGRVLIPKRLLEIIGDSTDLVLAGLETKIEIWSKEAFEKMETNENDFASLAEKILGQ
jgi:MraZ protein